MSVTAQDIVQYIRMNRVSTTEVADCLGKTGAVGHLTPITTGSYAVGEVFLAVAHHGTNWPVHEAVREAPPDSVVIIEAFDCGDRAIVGDLVAKFLTLYRQVAAVAVVGKVRDAPRIIRERWPVWSEGVSPVGCTNSLPETELPHEIWSGLEHRYQGGVAVCDDSGVVVIPASEINESLFERLEAIEALEDAWYDCIDKRKWDTFETVCLRKYEDLPPATLG